MSQVGAFSFADISQEEYRRHLEDYQRGILVADLQLRIAYVSPALTELCGRSADELIGTSALALFGLPENDGLAWDAPRELEVRDRNDHVHFLHWRPLGQIEPWRFLALIDVTQEVRASAAARPCLRSPLG